MEKYEKSLKRFFVKFSSRVYMPRNNSTLTIVASFVEYVITWTAEFLYIPVCFTKKRPESD